MDALLATITAGNPAEPLDGAALPGKRDIGLDQQVATADFGDEVVRPRVVLHDDEGNAVGGGPGPAVIELVEQSLPPTDVVDVIGQVVHLPGQFEVVPALHGRGGVEVVGYLGVGLDRADEIARGLEVVGEFPAGEAPPFQPVGHPGLHLVAGARRLDGGEGRVCGAPLGVEFGHVGVAVRQPAAVLGNGTGAVVVDLARVVAKFVVDLPVRDAFGMGHLADQLGHARIPPLGDGGGVEVDVGEQPHGHGLRAVAGLEGLGNVLGHAPGGHGPDEDHILRGRPVAALGRVGNHGEAPLQVHLALFRAVGGEPGAGAVDSGLHRLGLGGEDQGGEEGQESRAVHFAPPLPAGTSLRLRLASRILPW